MRHGSEGEQVHEFELVIDGAPELTGAVDALFESGCDDATLSIRSGQFYIQFSRRATSREQAIDSAKRDVERAGFRIRSAVADA